MARGVCGRLRGTANTSGPPDLYLYGSRTKGQSFARDTQEKEKRIAPPLRRANAFVMRPIHLAPPGFIAGLLEWTFCARHAIFFSAIVVCFSAVKLHGDCLRL